MAVNFQSFSVPFQLTSEVETVLEAWRSGDKLARLWKRDASLWTGADEADWLGWLDAPGQYLPGGYDSIYSKLSAAQFSDVLLLGMGGSVLCPALLGQVFGPQPGHPTLSVLDSLDPADIRDLENSIDLEHTLVVVSSKSGSTLESRLLMAYFLERMRGAVGPEKCGEHFVAITDPGSGLVATASELGFRHVFEGKPDIGGRFSAFSSFGLVPLALMGVDVDRFVADTMPMVHACGPGQSVAGSPGVLLGVILAVAARRGHDKVTLVASASISGLADWLEQLLAESTGKSGVGLIPVTGEELRPPGAYGNDRLFVYLRMEGEADTHGQPIAALEESGQPVVRIAMRDAFSIGQELFRWEIATAVAGSELGVHPFDQPDVEASKRATRELMSDYERTGQFREETPTVVEPELRAFFAPVPLDSPSASEGAPGFDDCVQAFLGALGEGDYCALLAYAPHQENTVARLERLRWVIAESSGVAVTLSHGPRYLHSSGQLHKGGPDTGAFLILVSADADDVPVPGHPYSFGIVKAAQARGDASILAAGGRSVLRIEATGGFEEAIERIAQAASGPS